MKTFKVCLKLRQKIQLNSWFKKLNLFILLVSFVSQSTAWAYYTPNFYNPYATLPTSLYYTSPYAGFAQPQYLSNYMNFPQPMLLPAGTPLYFPTGYESAALGMGMQQNQINPELLRYLRDNEMPGGSGYFKMSTERPRSSAFTNSGTSSGLSGSDFDSNYLDETQAAKKSKNKKHSGLYTDDFSWLDDKAPTAQQKAKAKKTTKKKSPFVYVYTDDFSWLDDQKAAVTNKPTYVVNAEEYDRAYRSHTTTANKPVTKLNTKKQKKSADPQLNQDRTQPESAADYCIDCKSNTSTSLHKALAKQLGQIDRDLKVTYSRSNKNLRADYSAYAKNFKSTCNMNLNSYINYMESTLKSKEYKELSFITPEYLLEKAAGESSLRCDVTGDNGNAYGVFQMNRKVNSVAKLKKYSPSQLKKPRTNFIAMLKSTKQMLDSLKRNGFNFAKMTDGDKLRFLASAHNGGAAYLIQGKSAIADYNKKHKANLNAHKWEDMRLVLLERGLSNNQRRSLFSSKHNTRSEKWAIHNIKYVERILGRSDKDRLAANYIQQKWIAQLDRLNKVNTVA